MTRLLRAMIAVAFVVLGFSVVGGASPAFACSCAAASIQDHADGADVVFRGTVVAITPPADAADSAGLVTYDIQARTVFKGSIDYATQVQSAASGASCGLENVEVGTEFIFFATGTTPPYQANLCGGTQEANPDRLTKIESVLGSGTSIEVPPPPAPTLTNVEESPPASFSRLAAPGGAVVVLGLLGLLLVRRLASR